MLSVASSLVFLVFLGVGEACWPKSMPAHRERFNVSNVEFTRLDGVGICGGAMFNVGPKADPHTLGHCLLRCANQTDCWFVVFKYHNVSSVNDNVTDADGNQTAWIMAKGICFKFRCRQIDYWKNNTATLQAVTMVKNEVLLTVTAEEPFYPEDFEEPTNEYEDDYDAIDANLTAAASLVFSAIENATLAEANNTSPANSTEDPLIRIMAPNDAEPSNLQVVFSNSGEIQEQEQNGINDFPANSTDVARAKDSQTLYGGRFDPDHGERPNGNGEPSQAIAATSSNSASIGAPLEQKQHRHRPRPQNLESTALFYNGTGHQTVKEALLFIHNATEQSSSRNATGEAEAESRPHSADDDESLPQGSTKPKTVNRVLQEAGREEEGVLAVLNDYDGLVELGNGTNSGVNVTSLPGKIKEDPTIQSKLKGHLNQSFDNVGEDNKSNGSDASIDQKNPGNAEKNPPPGSKMHQWNQEENANITTLFLAEESKVGSENGTNVIKALPANEKENAQFESLVKNASNGSSVGHDDAKESHAPGDDAGKPEAKGVPGDTPKGSYGPSSNSGGGDGKSGEKELPGNEPAQEEKSKGMPNPAGRGFNAGIGEGPGSGGSGDNQKLNQ